MERYFSFCHLNSPKDHLNKDGWSSFFLHWNIFCCNFIEYVFCAISLNFFNAHNLKPWCVNGSLFITSLSDVLIHLLCFWAVILCLLLFPFYLWDFPSSFLLLIWLNEIFISKMSVLFFGILFLVEFIFYWLISTVNQSVLICTNFHISFTCLFWIHMGIYLHSLWSYWALPQPFFQILYLKIHPIQFQKSPFLKNQ